MKKNFFAKLIALSVVLGLAYAAEATETVFRTAWMQDFESADTYLAQITNGSYAKTNTAEIVSGSAAVLSQGVRAKANRDVSKYLNVAHAYNAQQTSLLFTLPADYRATDLTEYKVEWDWFIIPAYSNSNPPYSHYQVVGNNGILAVIEVNYSGLSSQTIYNGSGESVGAITVGSRGMEPSDDVNRDYWHHFTVVCTNGVVTLDVDDRAGRSLVKGGVLARAADQVKLLSFEMRSGKNDYAFNAGLDDVAISLPTTSSTEYTWAGPASGGLWSDAANWTTGGVTTASIPTSIDTVIIPANTTVIVDANAVCSSVELGSGSKLDVRFIRTGESFTIPSGVTASSIEAITGPFTTETNNNVITVLAYTPSVFTWCGDITGNWSDVGNWSVGGVPTAVLPEGEDTAQFPDTLASPVTVSMLDSSRTVSNVVLGVGLTLVTGANATYDNTLYLNELNGVSEDKTVTNALTLAGASIATRGTSSSAVTNMTVRANIRIDTESSNRMLCQYGCIDLYGNLCGDGQVLDDINNQSYGVRFHGDNSQFAGTFNVKVESGAKRDYTSFETAAASSEDAVWETRGFMDNVDRSNSKVNFLEENATYKFGALSGYINVGNLKGATFEIGKRSDVASVLGGYFGLSTKSTYNDLVKVGTNELTFMGASLGNVTIKNGIYNIGSAGAIPVGGKRISFAGAGAILRVSGTTTTDEVITYVDPSASISNSTSAITFDDQGTNRTWSAALSDSNTAGFTKMGGGMLTLDAAPLWTTAETITVLDGQLNVTNDDDFVYTTGTATKVVTNGVWVVFTVAEKTTVTFTSEHIVVSTNGIAIASGDKVKVGDTITISPETGYAITSSILVNDTAIEGTTYTVTGSDAVTISATAVPILTWNNEQSKWWPANAWTDSSGNKVTATNDGSFILPDVVESGETISSKSISTYNTNSSNSPVTADAITVTATTTAWELTAGSTAINPKTLTLNANSILGIVMTKGGSIEITTLNMATGSRFLMKTSGTSTVGTANLADGSILDLDVSGSDNNSKAFAVPTFTTTILDSGAVVSVIAASTIAAGDVVLNWTTAPTSGSFVLSDETLRSQFKLVVTDTGLEVQARSSEEDLEEKQISVAEENTVAIDGGLVGSVITNVDISITTPFALTGHGGFVMTNKVDGTANKLKVSEGGILVLNPPRCPVRLATAPVLSGKLALASEYRHNTIGKFTLMTWDDGAALGLPTDLDAVFTNTTMATSFDLYVTNATWVSGTAKSLVLTLGNYATDKTPLKLMPLGDSITEGVPKDSGQLAPTYRLPLAAKLTAAGYDVTTVGWRRTSTNDATDISAPFEWCYHSGKEGEKLTWTASTTARGAIQESLEAMLDQAGVPDVITFMIGTNDLGYEKDRFTAAVYEEALTNVLWRIYNYRPTTKVVLSTLLDLNIGGTTYDPLVASNCVKVVRGLFADGNAYGFPEHFLYLNDAYDQVPRKVNGVYQGNFLKSGNVHPNFVGHDKFSDTWFVAVTNALADAAAAGSVTVNTGVGAEANVPDTYRSAFTKIATYTVDTNKQYSATSPVTYTIVDATKTNHIARIAYYLELKRVGSEHRRFVWVDMNAFNDRTLVGMGIPTGYDKWGRVTNLHVCSNDPAVHNIAANDNDEQGWLQFTLKRSGVAATNLVTSVDGNPGCFDCNDVIDASKNGGAMQVYRLVDEKPWYRPPAELVFAFGGWANDKKYARQIGIGNFAQHAISGSTPSINYYNVNNETMGASAYEVMNFEIWAVQQTADEQAADDYTWTGGGDGRLWTDIVNWGNVNMYPGYGEGDRAIFDRNYSPANVELNQDLSISNFVMNGGIETTSNILVLASTDHHTLTITGTNGSVRAEDYCALTITNLKFSVTGDLSTLGSGQQDNNSIVRLEAGNEFTGSYLFVNGTNSYLYVDGGTYTLSKEVRLQNGGHFIITGGTVTTPTILTKYSSGYSDSGCTADFDGGSFTSKNSSVSNVAITVLPTATLKFTSANGAKNFAEAVTPAAKTIDMGGTAVDVTKYYKGLVDSENKITGYTLRTSGENSVVPTGAAMVAATGGGVAVTPGNVKKGFYYTLLARGSDEETYTAGTAQQATADDATLNLTNAHSSTTSKVMYYKVQVSDTAQ